MDFLTQSAAYLDAFQADMKRDFHLTVNAEYEDRRFPLYAAYVVEDTTTLLMKDGKSVYSYEFCYFDTCEQLDDAALDDYCAVIEAMAARYVPWKERTHGFSMLSMIVLTGQAPDRAMQKRIRKYKFEKKSKRGADTFGWCSGRLCVVDVSTGTCYVNSHGRELANRVRPTVQRVHGK